MQWLKKKGQKMWRLGMCSMQRPFDAQISEACAVVTPLLPDDGDWESNRNSWYAWCTNEHVNLNRNRLHTNYIVYERTCEPWWKTNYTQNVKAMDRNWNATCGWVGAPINLLFCMKACFRNCNQSVLFCDSPHIFWWHVFRINCSAPTSIFQRMKIRTLVWLCYELEW